MKIAISVPDPVFKAGEHLARQLKLSRSQLYADALSAYLGSRGGAAVTNKLNEIYSSEAAKVDAQFTAAQFNAVANEAW